MTGENRGRDYVERYSNLRESTREWLESRRDDDWKKMDESMEFYLKIKSNGKFVFWVITSILGAIMAMASFGESLVKMWTWMKGH